MNSILKKSLSFSILALSLWTVAAAADTAGPTPACPDTFLVKVDLNGRAFAKASYVKKHLEIQISSRGVIVAGAGSVSHLEFSDQKNSWLIQAPDQTWQPISGDLAVAGGFIRFSSEDRTATLFEEPAEASGKKGVAIRFFANIDDDFHDLEAIPFEYQNTGALTEVDSKYDIGQIENFYSVNPAKMPSVGPAVTHHGFDKETGTRLACTGTDTTYDNK